MGGEGLSLLNHFGTSPAQPEALIRSEGFPYQLGEDYFAMLGVAGWRLPFLSKGTLRETLPLPFPF